MATTQRLETAWNAFKYGLKITVPFAPTVLALSNNLRPGTPQEHRYIVQLAILDGLRVFILAGAELPPRMSPEFIQADLYLPVAYIILGIAAIWGDTQF